jgi:uncharacterized protein YydD (DUF2326 family)
MEYDQRMIIKFSVMREPILTTLCRDSKNSFSKIFIHFEQSNSGLARYTAVVKSFMMKIAWENLLLMIMMQKFWIY